MKTKQTLDVETLEPISVPNTMTCNFIQTLINNYRSNHLVSIKDKLGFDDAHSIHFDLATLKKFISDIETETKKSNPSVTEEDLGIRFYYAAYPKTADWEIMADTPIGIEYAQKHTLVMIPTMKMEDEEGEMLPYDFNPLGAGNSDEVLAMASSKNVNDPSEESLAQNHGQLIPPSDPKVELF